MAEFSKTITINDGQTPRKFVIKKMGAYQAESWVYRAVLAIGHNVDDIQALMKQGRMGILTMLLKVDYQEARKLLDELLACVSIVNGETMKPLDREGCALIENPVTLFKLRVEAAKVNLSFFPDGESFSSLLDELFPQKSEASAA